MHAAHDFPLEPEEHLFQCEPKKVARDSVKPDWPQPPLWLPTENFLCIEWARNIPYVADLSAVFALNYLLLLECHQGVWGCAIQRQRRGPCLMRLKLSETKCLVQTFKVIPHSMNRWRARLKISSLNSYYLTLLQNMCAFSKARWACKDFLRLPMSRWKMIKISSVWHNHSVQNLSMDETKSQAKRRQFVILLVSWTNTLSF